MEYNPMKILIHCNCHKSVILLASSCVKKVLGEKGTHRSNAWQTPGNNNNGKKEFKKSERSG